MNYCHRSMESLLQGSSEHIVGNVYCWRSRNPFLLIIAQLPNLGCEHMDEFSLAWTCMQSYLILLRYYNKSVVNWAVGIALNRFPGLQAF